MMLAIALGIEALPDDNAERQELDIYLGRKQYAGEQSTTAIVRTPHV